MSKKKSFGGATMSLKDFHGGSIPSDLPLPSAPGLSARPPDRPAAWGAPARPRAAGSGGVGTGAATRGGLGDRPPLPFLPRAPAHFDEDERKPFFAAAGAAEPAPCRPLSEPVLAPPPPGPAWLVPRREDPPSPISSSGPAAASRLVQASAVEKVASGRWQSRPPAPAPVLPDLDAIRVHEMDGRDRGPGESVRIAGEAKDRSFVGFHSQDQERVRSPPVNLEPKESDAAALYSDGLLPVSSDGRFGGTHPNRQGPADALDRPKLKLLPRLKPSDSSGTQMFVDKQPPLEPVHVVNAHEIHGNTTKPGSAGVNESLVERPRLNLKPRSQLLEQSNESFERERKSVFGGARPRELVLKERGVDSGSNVDETAPLDRVKHDIPKPEPKELPVASVARHSERANNFMPEQRSARDMERKNHQQNLENMDIQASSWRNDHRKNGREIEKPLELQYREPDTWRKPVEEPKPDAPGPRFGKAASALELAQSFSRPVSDNQRGMPGRSQVTFSRLTDTRDLHAGRPQRQINGY